MAIKIMLESPGVRPQHSVRLAPFSCFMILGDTMMSNIIAHHQLSSKTIIKA